VHGVSTRKVDDLLKALGLDGMSKSEVSRSAWSSTARSRRFARGRSRASTLRVDRRDVPQGASGRAGAGDGDGVAIGVTTEGERQILAWMLGRRGWPLLDGVSAESVKRGLRG